MGVIISCVFRLPCDIIVISLKLTLGSVNMYLRLSYVYKNHIGILYDKPRIGIIAGPTPPMLEPNEFFYFRSVGQTGVFMSALKWAPTQSYFVNIYDTLGFTAIWRNSI